MLQFFYFTEHDDVKVSDCDDYKPEMFLHYNKTKSAVDTTHNLAQEYTTQRKSNQWPMAIFSHLLKLVASMPINFKR